MTLAPISLAVVVGPLLMASVAVGEGGEPAKEVEKLQGKWKATKIEGRNPGKLDGVFVTIKGNKLTLEGQTQKPMEFTFRLNPSAKPKAIDLMFELGTLLGVYELDGDALKVCYSELQDSEKGKRPTELTAPADSRRYLWVLKREK
jgi:uncharacterized protein (TIGR03067 family)